MMSSPAGSSANPPRPWLSAYAPAVPHSLAPYPDQPLFAFLQRSAALYPRRPCTRFKGQVVTYAEMDALSDRLACGLVALGVRRGDRVGLFMPNTPHFILSYYAILKAGGVVVAANPLDTPYELERQLQETAPQIALVTSNFYARLKAAQPHTSLRTILVSRVKDQLPPWLGLLFGIRRERLGGHKITLEPGDHWLLDVLHAQPPGARPEIQVTGDDLALIQFSGGTTGTARGALIAHRSLVANTLQMRAWLHDVRDAAETVLLAIPLFHVYGMVAGMSIAIHGAATLLPVPDPRDAQDLLNTIRRSRPTAFVGVPTLYQAIVQHPHAARSRLNCLRICVCGSTPLPSATRQAFERLSGCEIIEGYGLSEAPTVVHANPYGGHNEPGSIGVPLPDVECQIVSLEDAHTLVPPGEVGEMIIRSPQVFQGYWNGPIETAGALRPLASGEAPWLFTGDIVRMNASGYFFIVDRKKEVIKASGFQVLPSEVEEVLASHPAVQAVCVGGVPDPYRGETVKAWVVLNPGQTVTPDALRRLCQEKLARYKIPTQFEFRQELPLSTVGKVLRRELVRQHIQSRSQP